MVETAIIYFGEELAAQGFRLAGVRVETPPPGEEFARFQSACAGAMVVLVSAEYAGRLPQEALEAAQLGVRPIVYVLPPGRLGEEPRGAAHRARRVLGIDS